MTGYWSQSSMNYRNLRNGKKIRNAQIISLDTEIEGKRSCWVHLSTSHTIIHMLKNFLKLNSKITALNPQYWKSNFCNLLDCCVVQAPGWKAHFQKLLHRPRSWSWCLCLKGLHQTKCVITFLQHSAYLWKKRKSFQQLN